MSNLQSGRRILVGASMNGGAEAISPVIKKLREQGANVRVLSYRAATGAFRSMGIEPDRIIEKINSGTCRNELHEFRPSVVLTGTQIQDAEHERTFEQMLWAISRSTGSKSVAVLDTWDSVKERFCDLDPGASGRMEVVDGSGLRLPSLIALPGQSAMKVLLDAGVPKDIVHVTGNPYFDYLKEEAALLPAETRKMLLERPVFSSFSKDGALIVFISDSMERYPDIGFSERSVMRQFFHAVDELAAEYELDINVVVRPHPFRNEGAAEAFDMETLNLRKLIHNPDSADVGEPQDNYSLLQLIKAADIVVGTFNNPLISAAILGVPAIQFLPNMNRKYKSQEYLAKMRSAARLFDQVQLKDVIRFTLSGKFRLTPFEHNEGATGRVIELI